MNNHSDHDTTENVIPFENKGLEAAIRAWGEEQSEETAVNVLQILRDSYVWIPCNVSQDEATMEPDLLENEGTYFFPVFTRPEMIEEYGETHTAVEVHFLEAMCLAKNHEKNPFGVLVNPFNEPFLVPEEGYYIIASCPSSDADHDAEVEYLCGEQPAFYESSDEEPEDHQADIIPFPTGEE